MSSIFGDHRLYTATKDHSETLPLFVTVFWWFLTILQIMKKILIPENMNVDSLPILDTEPQTFMPGITLFKDQKQIYKVYFTQGKL